MDSKSTCRRCGLERTITATRTVRYWYPLVQVALCGTIGHYWLDDFEQYRSDLIAFLDYQAMLMERHA